VSTWGPGSFDSDYAADWIHILQVDGLAALDNAFSAVNSATDPVDSASAAAAVAAAEVLALALGRPAASHIPEMVGDVLKGESFQADQALVASAQKAIARVRDASDLADQWEAVGDANEWQTNVMQLQSRLSGWSPIEVWDSAQPVIAPALPEVIPPTPNQASAKNLRGWTAGLFFGSLAYPLLQAFRGGVPSLLVYGLMTLVLIITGLALLGSGRISSRLGAGVYIGLALVLVFVAAFLKLWVASAMAG
jgi:hypothetical protein